MKLNHVQVTIPTKPRHKEQFKSALPEATIKFSRLGELTDAELAQADALVGNPNEETLLKLKNLKILQLASSGVAPHFLKLKDMLPNIVLCSTSGAFGQAISEHMLAMLLSLMKRLHEYRDDQGKEVWKDRGSVRSFRNMRVLVVGAGNIGTEFAKLVKLLGADTVGIRRTVSKQDAAFDELRTMDALDELLPQADAVAMSLPETKETIALMDKRRFGLMKKDSYLINVGRGSAVDQDALLDALRTGHLAGAAVDVTTPEPLPPDHPMWREKNLLITPHISGYNHLQVTQDNIVEIACANLAAWPDGPFTSLIDFETGYRAK